MHLQGGENFFLGQKVVSVPPGRECSPRVQFFKGNLGDVDGGRGYLGTGSFSVCFEGDD